MAKFTYDVFLSHSSQNKPHVRALAQRLKTDGLNVWFDEWVIQPGMSIPDAIENGLQNSKTLLVVMSDDAFGSDWVTLERQTALFRDPMNKDRRLLLLLLSDTDIPDMLNLKGKQGDGGRKVAVLASISRSLPYELPKFLIHGLGRKARLLQ